nr:YeeE/YedE family protein [uncultured Bdellovibrio sp.]
MNKQKLLQAFVALIVGLLFAIGLAISGMTQPQKVLGFLTLGSGWDPSLMFVMMGAIPVHAISYRWIRGKKSPLFDTKWHVPQGKEITKPLIIGSALFGIGWGLAGYCPGPALTSLGTGGEKVIYFVIAMVAGMLLHRLYMKITT